MRNFKLLRSLLVPEGYQVLGVAGELVTESEVEPATVRSIADTTNAFLSEQALLDSDTVGVLEKGSFRRRDLLEYVRTRDA